MNRLLFSIVIGLGTLEVKASCSEIQKDVEVEPVYEITLGNVWVHPNHPNIDTVTLTAPLNLKGMKLSRITVNSGGILDVPIFKFPIQYSTSGDLAVSTIEVDLDKIGDFHVSYIYDDGACSKAFHNLISL